MTCPYCKQEITSVNRTLVMDVTTTVPIEEDGTVDPFKEFDEVCEESAGGSFGVEYRCPNCGEALDIEERE
jgi:uncharacterized protein YbaR (Trm112 family)